jgi:hypothetical protein
MAVEVAGGQMLFAGAGDVGAGYTAARGQPGGGGWHAGGAERWRARDRAGEWVACGGEGGGRARLRVLGLAATEEEDGEQERRRARGTRGA